MFPQFLFQRPFNFLVETGENYSVEMFAIVEALHAGADGNLAGLVDRVAVDATGNCREGDTAKVILFGQEDALAVTGCELPGSGTCLTIDSGSGAGMTGD